MINNSKNNNQLKEITISYGIASLYNLEKLIMHGNLKNLKKTSGNIIREFNNEKWKDLKNILTSNPKFKLEELESHEDGEKEQYIYLNNSHLMAPPNWLRESNKIDLVQSIINIQKNTSFKQILEIGAGYGSKIISIMKSGKIPNHIKYVALDISENGLNICEEIANRNNLIIKTINFDYLKGRFSDLKLENETLIFSCYGIHYKNKFTCKDILDFINAGVKGGVHIEPCSDLLDNLEDKLYAKLALKYITQNNYTLNIGKAFKEAEEKGFINLNIEKKVSGLGLLPAWIIKWTIKEKSIL